MNGNKSLLPIKWWQWLLMYPTLVIALLGHIPNGIKLYHSYKTGVSFSKIDASSEQNNLWKKNLDCLTGLNFHEVTTASNATVSVGICKSGDVLVCGKSADPTVEGEKLWISFSQIKKKHTSLIIKDAWAASIRESFLVAEGGATVICRKWIGDGLLLMRLKYPNGQCVDQTINTFTGVIISTAEAPCDSQC